jgi:hypothetical protein
VRTKIFWLPYGVNAFPGRFKRLSLPGKAEQRSAFGEPPKATREPRVVPILFQSWAKVSQNGTLSVSHSFAAEAATNAQCVAI